MNSIFRKSLLASAVAALAATPMWASADAGKMQGKGETSQQMHQPGDPTSSRWGAGRSATGTSAAVHAMTPSQLRGTDVVGPGGQDIGKVKAVVRSRDEKNIQAVISAGGVLGMGDKEIAVPLDSLRYEGGKLHTASTEEQLKARPGYRAEKYVELEPRDQPISEFSAFETVPDESRSTWERSSPRDALRDRPYPEGDRITP